MAGIFAHKATCPYDIRPRLPTRSSMQHGKFNHLVDMLLMMFGRADRASCTDCQSCDAPCAGSGSGACRAIEESEMPPGNMRQVVLSASTQRSLTMGRYG